jgi:hypothetical protein
MSDRHPGKHRASLARKWPGLRQAAAIWVPIVSLAFVLVAPTAAQAATVSATLSQGPPGTSVTVSGGGFQANDDLEVDWDDVTPTLTEMTADGAGSFTTTVTVPADAAAGTHQLQIRRQLTSTVLASTPFQVTSPAPQSPPPCPGGSIAINPAVGYARQTFTISGTDWVPEGSVLVSLPYGSPGIFRTDPDPAPVGAAGDWRLTATVDDTTPRGDYIFTASEPAAQCLGGTLDKIVTFQVVNPPANGCSTVSSLVPYRDVFEDACNHHDECYMDNGGPGKPSAAKDRCDEQFHARMNAACDSEPENTRETCRFWADTYFQVVQNLGNTWFTSENRANRAGPELIA